MTVPEHHRSEQQPTTMGARIRHVRNTRALSQTALAKLAGVTQPVISDLESNRTRTSERTASIAAALGVDALWLETGHSELESPPQETLDGDIVSIPLIIAPGNCGGRGY